MWNFIVCTGKDTTYGQRHPGEQTPLRIVLELAHNLLDKGYCLYLDNWWYTSPKLDDNLCTTKTDVVGTIRANKKRVPRFHEEGQTTTETVAALHKKKITISGEMKEMSHSSAHFIMIA